MLVEFGIYFDLILLVLKLVNNNRKSTHLIQYGHNILLEFTQTFTTN